MPPLPRRACDGCCMLKAAVVDQRSTWHTRRDGNKASFAVLLLRLPFNLRIACWAAPTAVWSCSGPTHPANEHWYKAGGCALQPEGGGGQAAGDVRRGTACAAVQYRCSGTRGLTARPLWWGDPQQDGRAIAPCMAAQANGPRMPLAPCVGLAWPVGAKSVARGCGGSSVVSSHMGRPSDLLWLEP